ncbi:uroporphyrinogen decarboxylase [Candidatus Epulonipiscium fishelsonii]|uniref:Uroporphyrinogen decarboxylase n=1 Tax=Candidatus Epulonipiscium fishelsonii TaxID=77094 RepID=A0ACC8XC01_9FIRM|nr:uroporphyrinogen decarboxylase [Epulopiscium sp. SCG-B11WGA-EpuloA1]ONI43574.1 uroporphyrinogen decarboxylase [Epulopiscium sp. SCG-B05WGA-EpuloA1]
MNSLERMIKALNHEEADHVPVYPIVNSVSRKTLGISYEEWTKDIKLCGDAIIKITDELELDCICTLVDLSVEAADFGQELLYFEDKAACPNHHNRVIKDVEDYANVKAVDPTKTHRMSEHIELARYLVEQRGDVKPVVGFVFGPLGILGMLRGQEDLFIELLTDPEEVHPALKEITKTLIQFCDALIDAGVHAIMFDTLFASTSIMSEAMWEDFEGDYIQEIADHVHARGCMVMLHNCGQGAYFEAQIKRMNPCLISFLHVPHGSNSYEEVKEKFGDKITLMGAIDPGWMMVATEDEIREASKKLIDMYKKDGGFVLATGCEYPACLDFGKARAMVEVAKEYGKY